MNNPYEREDRIQALALAVKTKQESDLAKDVLKAAQAYYDFIIGCVTRDGQGDDTNTAKAG